jgi:hypothetical protein
MLHSDEAYSLHRFWHARVTDLGGGLVDALVHYVDPWFEVETRVVARARDYKVREATATICRTREGLEGTGTLRFEGLVGAIAYAGVGRRIAEAVADDPTGLIRGLLLENVKALRQARLFVWEREGIDPRDQMPLIEKLIKNSCIYFSLPGSLESVVRPRQLQEMRRAQCLFARTRYSLMRWQGEEERVCAGLSDSYHEMAVEVHVKGDRLTFVEGRILRAPHRPCFDAEGTYLRLRGIAPTAGPAAWEKRLLGPDGCTHLADVAREACASLAYWRKKRSPAALEDRVVHI